jgi:hypothetical protein
VEESNVTLREEEEWRKFDTSMICTAYLNYPSRYFPNTNVKRWTSLAVEHGTAIRLPYSNIKRKA